MTSPVWAPDGRSIAYFLDHTLFQPGNIYGPYITDVSCMQSNKKCEPQTTRIDIVRKPDKLLTWSPDGEHVVILNQDTYSLSMVSLETEQIEKIIEIDADIYTLYWPSGQDCFFYSQREESYMRQSLIEYCLNTQETSKRIKHGGYIVGWVTK